MSRIVYETKDKKVHILIPSEEVKNVVGLKAIAEKDAPQDCPYWLVSDKDIPSDRTDRDAWQVDESYGEPDGFGGESHEFTDKQLLKLYQQGVIK